MARLNPFRRKPVVEECDNNSASMGWTDYQRLFDSANFSLGGVQYILPRGSVAKMTALQGQRNPIVAACVSTRMKVFSEITFQFQPFPKRGALYGKPALRLLETPWPGGSTQQLLAIMESDVSFYGNSYWLVRDGQLTRLEPDRVKILSGDYLDDLTGESIGAQILGYIFTNKAGKDVAWFQPDEVVHYKPIPDPENPLRGMSWLSAIIPDVASDSDMTTYKASYLNNPATPNLVVTFKDGIPPETIDKFRDRMENFHTRPDQSFKTLYVGAGADVKAIGANFADMNFAAVQSQGETRIAAAAGVPASLPGIAEGLRGSTLNEGNFTSTRRAFADGTLRPLWRSVCNALSVAVKVPSDSRLWYMERDVPFLQLDEQDAAAIRETDANTMLALINSGYDPDSVRDCIIANDWTGLVHIGALSVQLQPISDTGTFPAPQDPSAAIGDPLPEPGDGT